jgi:hypothetical protein
MRAGKSDFHSANKIKLKRKANSTYVISGRGIQSYSTVQVDKARTANLCRINNGRTTPLPLEMIYFLQHLFNTGCNPI